MACILLYYYFFILLLFFYIQFDHLLSQCYCQGPEGSKPGSQKEDENGKNAFHRNVVLLSVKAEGRSSDCCSRLFRCSKRWRTRCGTRRWRPPAQVRGAEGAASFLSCRRAPRFALFLQMEGSIAGGLPEVGNSVHSPMARVSSLRFIFREMGCFTRNFKRGERKKTQECKFNSSFLKKLTLNTGRK